MLKLVPTVVLRFARRLRFPYLFALSALLFAIDLAVPDIIPFADEILLGLLTLLIGSRKRRDDPTTERAITDGDEADYK